MLDITYATILYISFYTSLISFGGGYLVLPLLEAEYCDKRTLITKKRLNELASMAQSSPGAIAINLSAGLAYEVKGIKGLLLASLGSVLPPFIIIIIVSKLPRYIFTNSLSLSIFEGLDLAVIAIMLSLNLSMALNLFKEQGIMSLIFSFLITAFTLKFNIPLPIVLISIFLFLRIQLLMRQFK